MNDIEQLEDCAEDIEFQQTPGWGFMVANGWGICLLLIFLSGVAGFFSTHAGALILIISTISFLLIAFTKVYWSARINEKIICRNVYFFGFIASSKFQRIEQDYWLQCRRSSSGLILEICKGNAWETITLQEVYFGKFGPTKYDRQGLDRLRASLAQVTGIEDRGWDRYSMPAR
ncbi:hypothetical protein AB4851_17345 [Burkholderia sp. 22PA0099]|uniref:hypothetical protein n=1 Tax=Burkholderia sp. 22PA0099 TaxID=3237372 RepID=UPI0039C20D4B